MRADPAPGLVTAADAVNAHDADAQAVSYPRRRDDALPFDPSAIPEFLPVMFDTNFDVLGARRKLPAHIRDFVEAWAALHCGIALAEISISVGLLDLAHPKTMGNRAALWEILATIS